MLIISNKFLLPLSIFLLFDVASMITWLSRKIFYNEIFVYHFHFLIHLSALTPVIITSLRFDDELIIQSFFLIVCFSRKSFAFCVCRGKSLRKHSISPISFHNLIARYHDVVIKVKNKRESYYQSIDNDNCCKNHKGDGKVYDEYIDGSHRYPWKYSTKLIAEFYFIFY
jgi:hypothetical protein